MDPVPQLQSRVLGNKRTEKDNADSGVQFITWAGPRQSLLLAKQLAAVNACIGNLSVPEWIKQATHNHHDIRIQKIANQVLARP